MANTKKYVSLDKLDLYNDKIKEVISNADTATLNSAKAYAESLGSQYDVAGAAKTVQDNLDIEVNRAKGEESRIEGLVKTAQDEVNALELVVAEKADQTALDELEALVGTLPEGTTAKDVVDYVNIKTAGIATDAALEELQGQLNGVQGEVNTIKGDYLKGEDKEEVVGLINAEKERAMGVEGGLETRLAAVEGDHLVEADKEELAGLIQDNADAIDAIEADYLKAADKEEVLAAVNTEKERAMGVESGFEGRIKTMENFFEGANFDEEGKNVLDTLVEIQTTISEDQTGASEMLGKINQNTTDIEALEGRMDVVEDELATVDTRIEAAITGANLGQYALDADLDDAVERIAALEGVDVQHGQLLAGLRTDVDAKATQADLEALGGKVTVNEGKIAALEGKFGGAEGSVEDMIADAKQEAINTAAGDATTKANAAEQNAKTYVDGEIDKVEETIATLEGVVNGKAAQGDLTALAGRVTTAEGEIDTLQTEMDAVEALAAANKAAHEANAKAIELKASQADLDAVSGRVTTLETWHNNFTEASEEEINALFQ